METKEVAQQVKLGAFVLAGIALFLTAVFFIGSENNIFSRTFNVSAVFKNVEGLKEGDNVWLSGVKIGRVTEVRIVSQGKVIVNLALKHNQHQFITEDATASVGSDGLVGNKIVVIRPGQSNKMVADGDTINTLSPTDTQELFNIAKDVGDNTRALTSDLKVITKRINAGEGVIGELLTDGELAKDLRLTVASLKSTGDNTAKLSAELKMLLTELRTGDGLLPTLIQDTAYAQTFTTALQNVEKVSAHANVVASNLETVASRMNDRDNALGVLLQDSAFAMRLRETMQNTEQATEKLDENMEALRHNFLFRRYFRKQDKKKEKEEEQDAGSPKGNVSAKK